ncbi:hypothetical protein OPEN69S_02180 [Ottowia pentelensis]
MQTMADAAIAWHRARLRWGKAAEGTTCELLTDP